MQENLISSKEQESLVSSTATELDLDCFGIMYDPYIAPCRDKCHLKDKCKEEVRKNVSQNGEDARKEEERRIMEKTLSYGEEAIPVKSKMEIKYSEPVMKIVDMMTKLGLQIHYKAGYIAAKLGKRNIFSITRAQSPDYNKVIKFIFTRERKEFPEEILPNVNECRSGKYWTCSAPDAETLENVLTKYIQSIKK